MEDREYSNVYVIPANYTDSGKLFGGMLEPRNTVETALLLLMIGYPELVWMQTSGTVKVVIMTVTLLPVCVFGLMGIGGDSLIQYFINMVWFWIRRRKLHFRRIGYRYEHSKNTRKRRSAARPKKSP